MPLTIRRPLPAVLALLLAAVVLALPAAPASAHARLLSSEPAAGAVLDTAPDRIVLTFNEPVEAEFGQLQVSGPGGERIDEAPPTATGEVVEAPVAVAAEPGVYTVAYRIISEDGHPVEGTFTYELSEAVADSSAVADVEETTQGEGTGEATGTGTGTGTDAAAGGGTGAGGSAEDAEDATPTGEAEGADPAATPAEGTPAPDVAEDTGLAETSADGEGGIGLLPILLVIIVVVVVAAALLPRLRRDDDAEVADDTSVDAGAR
jgi:methionine-rich copper-binding protein CopC